MDDPYDHEPLLTSQPPEIMADTFKQEPEADTCRICRSEGTPDEPLFYPCKCSGSIKHVHQECLMEWLSHTNKKHCELCKTPFRFTKLYHADTPDSVPVYVFVFQAFLHVLKTLLSWLRAVLVAAIWLVILPWFNRWSWRSILYMLDAGWAREKLIDKLIATDNATDLATTEQVMTSLNSTLGTPVAFKDMPFTLKIFSVLIELLVPSRDLLRPPQDPENAVQSQFRTAATSTLLSDFDFVKHLSKNPVLSKVVVDVVEGQIITIIVVAAFILVFLIREWVIQQQPVLNAAANVRDAEQDLERVEAARQRIRDELRLVEDHLDQYNHPQGIRTHPVDHDVASIHDGNARTDWPAFGQRITAMTETWLQNNRIRPETARALVRDLSEQCLALSQRFHDEKTSDVDAFGQLLQWVRDMAPEVDSYWLHDVAAEFAKVMADARSRISTRQTAHATITSYPVTDIGDLDFRPEWADGSSSSQAAERRFSPEVQTDAAATPPPVSRQASQSTDSWQAIQTPSTQGASSADDPNVHIIHEQSGESHEEPTTAAADQNPLAASAGQPENPRDLHLPEQTLAQQLYDFFWGGIDLTVPAEEEPFLAAIHDDLHPAPEIGADPVGPLPAPEPPFQDPEVVAAAAEAGLDAEAIEDAEDMEGLMELIGLQGPIIMLFQTAFICGGLITFTLWVAVGGPYAFGKTILMIWADPMAILVVHPLLIVNIVADVLVDFATMLVGVIFFRALRLTSLGISMARIRGILQPLPAYCDKAAIICSVAVDRAYTHLYDTIAGSQHMTTTWASDSSILMASMHAHSTLIELKAGISGALASFVGIFTSLAGVTSISALVSRIGDCIGYIFADVKQDLSFAGSTLTRLVTLDFFPFAPYKERTYDAIDPLLAFWSGTDRFLCILIGYCALAALGAAYLLRSAPFFTHPTLQKIERTLADILKQAGGIIKVVLIISIEMLLFPLYCGILLDIALLPLYDGASISSRIAYSASRPYMSVFQHWFLGTAYMFNFALFVGMCRRLLRSGVLYFIRDPDDPTFHPVRDVLERNITTQLRKIAFSAFVYGLLVICCMGGVAWSIAFACPGLFPLRLPPPDPTLEFPIEYMLYNFLSPMLYRYIRPAFSTEDLYDWWLRRCARALRLSHFLFGERKEDEEAGVVGGAYVLAPASDQVRITKGQRVFQPSTESDVVSDERALKCAQHGTPGKKFRSVYIPPWFRMRIFLFLAGLWCLSAGIGLGLTISPLILGRGIFHLVVPEDINLSDIWAYAMGLHVLLLVSFVVTKMPRSMADVHQRTAHLSNTAIAQKVQLVSTAALKTIYVYGWLFVVVPAMACLLVNLYVVVPIRTYAETPVMPSINATVAESKVIMSLFSPTKPSDGSAHVAPSSPVVPSTPVQEHVFYVLPELALGLVVSQLITGLFKVSRYPLPTAITRAITRPGRFNPDAKLATRAIVLPTLLVCSVACLVPALFATTVVNFVLPVLMGEVVTKSASVRLYRYGYPLVLANVLTFWGFICAHRAVSRWRGIIKDEVYLVGERLHNFGETKPPLGSRGVMKKGKEPAN